MSEIDWDTPDIATRNNQNCDHLYQKGRTLVERMGIKEGNSVLDIGCGRGQQVVNFTGIIGKSGDPMIHPKNLLSTVGVGKPDGWLMTSQTTSWSRLC